VVFYNPIVTVMPMFFPFRILLALFLGFAMALPVSLLALDQAPVVEPVDAFMRSAEPGKRVTVEGVVSAVWPKRKRLGLIDAEEFRKCRVVTCAQMTLPVLWAGEMPEIASIVHIAGEVSKRGMRLIFDADSLDLGSG
jgi:hypothetical protein